MKDFPPWMTRRRRGKSWTKEAEFVRGYNKKTLSFVSRGLKQKVFCKEWYSLEKYFFEAVILPVVLLHIVLCSNPPEKRERLFVDVFIFKRIGLVGERRRRIRLNQALCAEDGFVYIPRLYASHWIVMHSFAFVTVAFCPSLWLLNIRQTLVMCLCPWCWCWHCVSAGERHWYFSAVCEFQITRAYAAPVYVGIPTSSLQISWFKFSFVFFLNAGVEIVSKRHEHFRRYLIVAKDASIW